MVSVNIDIEELDYNRLHDDSSYLPSLRAVKGFEPSTAITRILYHDYETHEVKYKYYVGSYVDSGEWVNYFDLSFDERIKDHFTRIYSFHSKTYWESLIVKTGQVPEDMFFIQENLLARTLPFALLDKLLTDEPLSVAEHIAAAEREITEREARIQVRHTDNKIAVDQLLNQANEQSQSTP